jgi:hypothetical protein
MVALKIFLSFALSLIDYVSSENCSILSRVEIAIIIDDDQSMRFSFDRGKTLSGQLDDLCSFLPSRTYLYSDCPSRARLALIGQDSSVFKRFRLDFRKRKFTMLFRDISNGTEWTFEAARICRMIKSNSQDDNTSAPSACQSDIIAWGSKALGRILRLASDAVTPDLILPENDDSNLSSWYGFRAGYNMGLIDSHRLASHLITMSQTFHAQSPWPHAVIDGLVNPTNYNCTPGADFCQFQ